MKDKAKIRLIETIGDMDAAKNIGRILTENKEKAEGLMKRRCLFTFNSNEPRKIEILLNIKERGGVFHFDLEDALRDGAFRCCTRPVFEDTARPNSEYDLLMQDIEEAGVVPLEFDIRDWLHCSNKTVGEVDHDVYLKNSDRLKYADQIRKTEKDNWVRAIEPFGVHTHVIWEEGKTILLLDKLREMAGETPEDCDIAKRERAGMLKAARAEKETALEACRLRIKADLGRFEGEVTLEEEGGQQLIIVAEGGEVQYHHPQTGYTRSREKDIVAAICNYKKIRGQLVSQTAEKTDIIFAETKDMRAFTRWLKRKERRRKKRRAAKRSHA